MNYKLQWTRTPDRQRCRSVRRRHFDCGEILPLNQPTKPLTSFVARLNLQCVELTRFFFLLFYEIFFYELFVCLLFPSFQGASAATSASQFLKAPDSVYLVPDSGRICWKMPKKPIFWHDTSFVIFLIFWLKNEN